MATPAPLPSQATTTYQRPPIQNTKIFPVKALQLERLVNDHLPPHISNREYFLGLTVNDFPLFFKGSLDAFSDLYVSYVYLMAT